MKGHDHDLDGKLHEECPMCQEIRARMPMAVRDKAAEQALARHRNAAERSRAGKQKLEEEKESPTMKGTT